MRKASSFLSSVVFSFRKFVLPIVVLGSLGFISTLSAQEPDATTTEAQPTTTNTTQEQSNEHEPTFIIFTRTSAHSDAVSSNATFGCSVGYPTVTANFTTNIATWSATISCSVSVGLYGTTVLFYYPSGGNVAYGNQINTTSTTATSSGSSYLSNGNYEVNFNIIITPPSGYTTTASGNCAAYGSNKYKCTVPSGEFTMQ
jgi:hypothetical protein